MKRSRLVLAGAVLAALALVALSACAREEKPAPAPLEAAHLRAQALIDSGSSAFRNGDFAAAAKRYASAAVVSPDDPAAYYGLGMSLAKLGRDDEARVAYARARELSRGELDDETIPHEVRYRRTKHP
ncbi:MAG TPA: tetratricopeptide repeat protein [Candidatus Eisenbacteria bacterium]